MKKNTNGIIFINNTWLSTVKLSELINNSLIIFVINMYVVY